MTETATAERLELRESDGVNLADDRIPCPRCNGGADAHAVPGQSGFAEETCSLCNGKGTVVRPTGRAHLSHSSISRQLNCLKLYEHHDVRRLELIARPRYFSLGTAFQKSIELSDPDAGVKLLREGRNVSGQGDEDRLQVDEAICRAAAALYLDRFGTPPGEEREYEYRVRLRSPWTGGWSRTFDLLGYA
ncbi:MAG TPA: hypothetical protein VK506_11585, partial [Conexibacter sp.]|nr:hypothetical protein [Conexibacter sp.]